VRGFLFGDLRGVGDEVPGALCDGDVHHAAIDLHGRVAAADGFVEGGDDLAGAFDLVFAGTEDAVDGLDLSRMDQVFAFEADGADVLSLGD
jgi:hypothetical protein